jgi:hypothetical protein
MSNLHVTTKTGDEPMNASFEERSVWIQLVSLLLVMGGYSYVAWHMWSRGVTALPAYVAVFAVLVVLMVVVMVGGHVAAALASRPDRRDERDRVIEWWSESYSGWLVGAGILAGIAGMVLSLPDVWVAHLLLSSLFLSEVLKLVLQLVFYRRGM